MSLPGISYAMSLRASPIVFFLFALCSCASLPALFLPTITDHRLEAFVAEEAKLILRVSENAHKADRYRFYLAKFPRDDILGLSFGEHRIFISYELTRLAREQTGSLWLFRHTLAHEIAHDALEHAKSEQMASLNSVRQTEGRITGRELGLPLFVSFRNYSPAAELAADQAAMEYWKKIGWDCGIWIKLFRGFFDQGATGDPDHPINERLSQAIRICEAKN
jgi:predicted Zn-dependent protease